jgi:D-sedoheptulose 7-phosphate isomerase
MKNLNHLFRESDDIKQFASSYFNYLHTLLNQLDTNAIGDFVRELDRARLGQHTVFFAGNGGSASTASHMANDIGMVALKTKRDAQPFRILALTDNVSVISAIANDDGYENVFVNQLKIHYRKDDKLVAISASGNSPNVVKAARWVKAQGGTVLGLTGFDGGELNVICDVAIHVKTPKGEYGPVEDIHMIMDHLITNYLSYRQSNT